LNCNSERIPRSLLRGMLANQKKDQMPYSRAKHCRTAEHFLQLAAGIFKYFQKNTDMFSVITLNMRFGLADDGLNSWQYRKECFPSFLEKYEVDFFGFQEVNDFQIDFLNKILTEYRFIGRQHNSPPFWQNNIIFYKKSWTCIYQDYFFLSPTPDVPSRFRKSVWPRQCTIGLFKNRDRKLVCVNTHFDFDSSVQIESAKIIMRRLANMPPVAPVILVGDFNAIPNSPCYNIFTGHDQKVPAEISYFTNVFKSPFPGTYHGFTGDREGDHIDWILYYGKIVVKDSITLRDTINDLYLSDHFPLYADFWWEV
jgi:endonuclease/exonuclease/phosphatase family metal-dependent hydrolase